MGHTDHSLINSDQCRHSGPEFQDNLYNQVYPMTITGPNVGFIACLQSVGTVLFLDTWHPIQKDLESFPHVEMTWRHHWNYHKIQLPQTNYVVQEEIKGRNVSQAPICFSGERSREAGGNSFNEKEVVVYDMYEFSKRLVSNVHVTKESALKMTIQSKRQKREIAASVRSLNDKCRKAISVRRRVDLSVFG